MSRFRDKKVKRVNNRKRQWYQKDDFRELQKEWYQKLSDSGFEDIEHFVPRLYNPLNSPYLKGLTSSQKYRYMTQNPYQFYRILSIFSHSQAFFHYFDPHWHKFNTFLIENYVNGASYRDLAKLVQSEITDKPDVLATYPTFTRYANLFGTHKPLEIRAVLKSKSTIGVRMKEIKELCFAWYELQDWE